IRWSDEVLERARGMTEEELQRFRAIVAGLQPRIDECIRRAIDGIDVDTMILVPRTAQECANGFEQWLANCKERLGPAIQTEFEREFKDDHPSLAGVTGPPGRINAIVAELVWPQV